MLVSPLLPLLLLFLSLSLCENSSAEYGMGLLHSIMSIV